MKNVVIVAGARTPLGNFGGALKDLSAQKLGELVVREVLARTKLDPALIDEVIMGCVGQSTDAPNIARVISLMAGLPIRTPGYSVQRNCSSGLQPFVNAFQNIQCGDADAQVVPIFGVGAEPAVTPCGVHRQRLGRPDRSRLRSAHGSDSRKPGRGVRHRSRGAGPLCGGKPPARLQGLAGESVQGRDRDGHDPQNGRRPRDGSGRVCRG